MDTATGEGSATAVITIFNRKELTVTFSMEQQANIRDLLAASNIRYYVKVFNTIAHGSPRGYMGSFGINMDAAYEYTFYVHRDDYEMACAVLAGNYGK